MDKATIQAAIDEYERLRAAVGGCGDGNCCIQKPAGMHTNGGCQCHHNHPKAGHMMRAGRQLHAAVVAALNA